MSIPAGGGVAGLRIDRPVATLDAARDRVVHECVLPLPIDVGHINVDNGHLIKYRKVEPTGRLEPVPELRNYQYQIEFETSSPQAINAWLRENGVTRVFASLEDHMRQAGVDVLVFR